MLPVARLGDTFADTDVIASGSGNVFINNIPCARLSDTTTGHGPPPCFWPPTVIVGGSGSVFVNNLPIARLSDPHAVHCCGPSCHDSVINSGSGNVFSG
jgi:uncharacterized Zn-binding protein involved in type VI secretion